MRYALLISLLLLATEPVAAETANDYRLAAAAQAICTQLRRTPKAPAQA